MKKLMLAILTLLSVFACGGAEGPASENVDQVQQALCPTTMTCVSPGPQYWLTGTDYCGTGPIKCFWGYQGGFTFTYIYPPAGCTACINNATGVQGTCYQTDPPASWTCSAP
jgi:hypothetical protein